MPIFLLLFIVVPLIEIALFAKVGALIGVVPTVAMVVFTAVAGVALLRWQGLTTLMRARERMQTGQMPAQEMLEGLMLAVAGVMLLTPGFFTDTLGFVLLIPPCRHGLYALVKKRIVVGDIGVNPHQGAANDGHTFEGEYYRRHDSKAPEKTLPPKK